YDQGVYRSTDAGATWRPANDGLPRLQGYPVYPIVEALSWDRDGALYAGLDPYGLFRSSDGGGHWTPVNFGAAITAMSTGVGARSLLYGGGLCGNHVRLLPDVRRVGARGREMDAAGRAGLRRVPQPRSRTDLVADLAAPRLSRG